MFWSDPGYYLGHLIDGVKEMSLNLQFGVDPEERRGEEGSAVLELSGINLQLDLPLLDDGGQHGEEIPIIHCPYLLDDHAAQPPPVLPLLYARVVDDPLPIGTQAGRFEVRAPICNQDPQGFLVGLFLFGGKRQVLA